jgi:hypothetical protein
MNKSQLIKDILVNLAANDQLPTDMTQLDEHIFDEALKVDVADLEAKAEQHALGQFLSEYPADMEYNEILERIEADNRDDESGDNIILVWEPFEYTDPSSLSENINNAKEATLELLKDVFA